MPVAKSAHLPLGIMDVGASSRATRIVISYYPVTPRSTPESEAGSPTTNRHQTLSGAGGRAGLARCEPGEARVESTPAAPGRRFGVTRWRSNDSLRALNLDPRAPRAGWWREQA